MAPGPANYFDGSGNAEGGVGTEIDMMETLWHPDGPQFNLPDAQGSGWSSSCSGCRSVQMASWSDIGGLPLTGNNFVTFGVLIRGDQLWTYGYRPDGSWWYSSPAIRRDSTWNQQGEFVPYIGTWPNAGNRDGAPVFDTCYKDFVYMPANDPRIAGANPADNHDVFGPALLTGALRAPRHPGLLFSAR